MRVLKLVVVVPQITVWADGDRVEAELNKCVRAGSVCYRSGDKTGERGTQFIRRLIQSGHESVLEHGNITIAFRGSRAMSHQLVRHRLCAFSQESQRYCAYEGAPLEVVAPGTAGVVPGCYTAEMDEHGYCTRIVQVNNDPAPLWVRGVMTAYALYVRMREDSGVAAEDARYLLPNATATTVVVTANFRQWRHMMLLRCHPHAQEEIRGLFTSVHNFFQGVTPVLVEDIPI